LQVFDYNAVTWLKAFRKGLEDMNSPIEIVQPSEPFSLDSSRCSISMGKSSTMLSKIKKELRNETVSNQIFSKFEHLPPQIDEYETTIKKQMRNDKY